MKYDFFCSDRLSKFDGRLAHVAEWQFLTNFYVNEDRCRRLHQFLAGPRTLSSIHFSPEAYYGQMSSPVDINGQDGQQDNWFYDMERYKCSKYEWYMFVFSSGSLWSSFYNTFINDHLILSVQTDFTPYLAKNLKNWYNFYVVTFLSTLSV